MSGTAIMPTRDSSPPFAFDEEPASREYVTAAEPVSPELALIDPVLRAQSIALFLARVGPEPFLRPIDPPPEPIGQVAEPTTPQLDALVEKQRSVLFMVPLHLAGSLITSFVFGVAFITTIAAVIVLLNVFG
jgi:hypothetical protein